MAMRTYKYEDLSDLVRLRAANSVLTDEHEAVRTQLKRLNFYDSTESHAEMVEDLINASELLAIELNRLRQEVLTLKLEKLYDQQTVRTYPLTSPVDFGGTTWASGFDPSGGGR